MNLVNKDLKLLCLYNIYSQTTKLHRGHVRGQSHLLEKSCGAAFNLALSNLGREPGTVGDGLQDWQ